MNNSNIKNIIICGNGLAGVITTAALAKALPKETKLTLIDTLCTHEKDIFYGNVTSTSTYAFLLSLGITEIELLTQSNTSFSLGTHYLDWGEEKNSWYQCHHQPLPLIQGVMFHHYLNRITAKFPEQSAIGPYIMSVCAANKGVFAHPSKDPKSPLKNIEYGYHFHPAELRKIIGRKLDNWDINIEKGSIKSIEKSNGEIKSLTLSNGANISGDFFIDCTQGNLGIYDKRINFGHNRTLKAVESISPHNEIIGSCRKVHGNIEKWKSQTFLQDKLQILSISEISNKKDNDTESRTHHSTGVTITTGFSENPWINNCLRLGHSAAVLSPLTPAPIMLLQNDVKRMLELIPISHDMKIEAKEYNRRFTEDYIHASTFESAFQPAQTIIKKESYENKIEELIYDKLKNKIIQFKSRGIVLQYDLEPFNNEDWIQIHLGMKRIPKRYDALADRLDENQLIETLKNIKKNNFIISEKIPPLNKYITGLIKYLRKQNDKVQSK
jgi:tryptophan halogenase